MKSASEGKRKIEQEALIKHLIWYAAGILVTKMQYLRKKNSKNLRLKDAIVMRMKHHELFIEMQTKKLTLLSKQSSMIRVYSI